MHSSLTRPSTHFVSLPLRAAETSIIVVRNIMRVWFAVSVLVASVSAQCALECNVGETCYASAQEGLDCITSIPYNPSWANATLDVLVQSMQNFGFDALYHSTGPPYVISMDIQSELAATQEMVNNGEFTTDIDFQEHLQDIFQRTLDAHTRYQKPACYNAIFVQPFAFDIRDGNNDTDGSIANAPHAFLMRNLYTDTYAALNPDIPVNEFLDKEVVLLNGVEFTTEVSQWGDNHETRSNNRGVRFNAAMRSYLYRSAISVSILPLNDLVITLANGDSYTLPWMTSYTTGLANTSLCAAQEVESASLQTKKHAPHNYHLEEAVAPMRLLDKPLKDEREDREIIVPSDSPYYVSCFVQTVSGKNASKVDVKRVLVMKVASFSPPGDYQEAWAGFLDEAEQCLSVDFDMIVVDVMQNGGGYVCLGLRLIELLVKEYELDHTKVQMQYDIPHSPLMDTYIDVVNAPNPYPYPEDVEQILNRETQESFVDGRAYYYPGRNVTQGGVVNWRTNIFSLDCREAEAMPSNGFVPPRFMPPEKLIILTDGTCGSTCASFTKIPQEAGKATFVGAGGIWNEGMDVSSFAGGFVCNPDYLYNIATWSNTTFPKFETTQRWQFGWAVWYSAKQPTRPIQFTVQDPDYREAFWGFPHVSIDPTVTTAMVSSLYDRVIESTINRLAATSKKNKDDNESDHLMSKTGEIVIIVLTSVFGAALLAIAAFYVSRSKQREQDGDLSKGLLA